MFILWLKLFGFYYSVFCSVLSPEKNGWNGGNAGHDIKVGFNSSWPNKDQTKLVTGKYIVKLSADIWSDGGGCSQEPAAGQCLLCSALLLHPCYPRVTQWDCTHNAGCMNYLNWTITRMEHCSRHPPPGQLRRSSDTRDICMHEY